MSKKAETRDLEAGTEKPKDEDSPRKRHYGPTKRKYQSNYTGLADLMAENPEKAIFRRFTQLNIKNLLYLQAELACLEEDLNDAVEHDKNFPDTKNYALSWALLEESDPPQDLVPDHMEGTEEHRSHLERSPSRQAALFSLVNAHSDIAQSGFDPSGSTYVPDRAFQTPSRRETGTSEDDISVVPTDSWPGGISHVRSTQQQRLRQIGHMNESHQSKMSSQEQNTERPSSQSHREKKHGKHQDRKDYTQPARSSILSDRPLHNDSPTLQRHLVHEIRTKLEKYSKLPPISGNETKGC